MKREELEKEAEGWLNKWELCNKCENKVNCISNFSYCKKVVLKSYLASAESREKQIQEKDKKITELEKENADLKELFEACKQERIEALYRNEQYIKENAELKKQLGMSKKVYNDNLDYSHHIEGQLTKAKVLLKQLVYAFPKSYSDVVKDTLEEAEQFLNEVEK